MWSTLVDFYSCRNRSFFLQLKEFRRNVELSMKGSNNVKVQQETRQEYKIVEVKQPSLRREDSNFKEKWFPQWRSWETSKCLHGRSVDRGIVLVLVIFYV